MKWLVAGVVGAALIGVNVWVERLPPSPPEKPPDKDLRMPCQRIAEANAFFASYPGPDAGAKGGDDAAAVFWWKRARNASSIRYLHSWAHGIGADKLKGDPRLLRDLRRFYDDASEQSVLPLSSQVTAPQQSKYLERTCSRVLSLGQS